ncbi:MAG TPA: double-strand break repair helicase AddA, partial [Pseudolabrys sp.]|nr:double-strand break repair helicase AddA [Pseudolabrys sp.]
LCITFTKAAAANMANKVFADLRAWTLLEDAALDEAMRKAGVKRIDAVQRLRARQLFALALETPGGLKVQTIHAFCTQLLHLFPFEANVAARFEVLDEISETRMLNELGLEVLLEAAEAPGGALGRALEQAVFAADDVRFQDVLREVIGKRDPLTRWIDRAGGIDKAIAELSRALGVRADETAAEVEKRIFDESLVARSEWASIAAALMGGATRDQEQGDRFHALATLNGADLLDRYIDIFCTKAGERRKRIATSAIEKTDPALCETLNAERERVWDLVLRKRAVEARDRSAALFTIADAVIARFRAEKDRRGLLDYDDLIDRTLELLRDQRSAWVHYKLDRGIHHVLIDEAQDTSPKQWEIVKALVGEFFAGQGAHERPRTIFAVGDEKQSIFSFQGAAPRAFAEMRLHFEAAHRRAGLEFRPAEFKHSFRSGANVLNAVDTVFARAEAFKGLTADAVAPAHEALPEKAPGLVEIWELLQSDKHEEKEGWKAPFDVQTVTSATAKLARRIAATVAAWRRQGRQAKDVLILLGRRGALFEAIIRALKSAGVPVAGADRLSLTEHIAVMDLMVLAEAILLPDDDLALATVLKSPLFGLDDNALFDLAWNRKGSLHAALRAKRPKLAAQFDAMHENARGSTPFAFYAWLLGAAGGRRKMLARLGHEANDALDEFLNLALDYERTETPSLQGFIAWLRAADVQVKRDMEMERDEVRVMTVHGAKGLEAPIVILADTTRPAQGWHPPRLLTLPPERPVPGAAGPLVWGSAKGNDVGPMGAAREAALDETRDEYRRLLYVAMTRAIERLIVCGVENGKKHPDGCWYDLVLAALQDHCTREPADNGEGEVLRFRKFAEAKKDAAAAAQSAAVHGIELPPWLRERVGDSAAAPALIRPSRAYAADAAPADAAARAAALMRGRVMHRLLQSLPDVPPERRSKAADEFVTRAMASIRPEQRSPFATLAEKAVALLGSAPFAALFGPGSRAEVPIVGTLPQGRASGQVDRLAVTQDAVWIGDFKTDAAPARRLAEVPAGYVRQLALYRAVLAKLYPDRAVRAALVWTEVPDFMEIPGAALDAALAQAHQPVRPLDAPDRRS